MASETDLAKLLRMLMEERSIGVMPRPGQPGAMVFDGRFATRFLTEWEKECSSYHVKDDEMVSTFARYCTPEISATVEWFRSYRTSDWKKFKIELLKEYRHLDEVSYTLATMESIVAAGPSSDLQDYMRKFDRVSAYLLEHKVITEVMRSGKFFQGLTDALGMKVLEHYDGKGKNFNCINESETPVYEDIVEFVEKVSDKANLYKEFKQQQKAKTVLAETEPLKRVPLPMLVGPGVANDETKPTTTPVTQSLLKPAVDADKTVKSTNDVDKISGMLEALTLQLKAQSDTLLAALKKTTVNPNVTSQPPAEEFSRKSPHCVWCNQDGHWKSQCDDLTTFISDGQVKVGPDGHLTDAENRLIQMVRGGLKVKFLAMQEDRKKEVASRLYQVCESELPEVSNPPVVRLANTAEIIPPGDEFDVEYSEVLAAERSAGRQPQKPYDRPAVNREQDTPRRVPVDTLVNPPNQYAAPRLRPVEATASPIPPTINDEPMPNVAAPAPAPAAAVPKVPKYKMMVPIKEATSIDDVGKRLLESEVTLSLSDMLGVSPDLRKFIETNCRTRRQLLPAKPTDTNPNTDVNVMKVKSDALSAASLSVIGRINGEKLRCILDTGSEINVMTYATVEKLGLPLDTSVQWGLVDANSTRKSLMGVCWNVDVDIGGVVAEVNFFVHPTAQYSLLLGRPWEKAVKAAYRSEGDDCFCKITDGHKVVTFKAVDPNSNRNIQGQSGNYLEDNGECRLYNLDVGDTTTPIALSIDDDSSSFFASAWKPREQISYCRTLRKSVAKKVRPINKPLPDGRVPIVGEKKARFRPRCEPGTRVTPSRLSAMKIGAGNLSQQEIQLFKDLIMEFEDIFAWTDDEKGRLAPHIEDEHSFLTAPHTPWAFPNIRMTKEVEEQAVAVIRKKLAAGTLEFCCGPYRNRWFLVPKKNGTGRLILDAQPMNKVMYKDAGMPPNVDEFSESFAGAPITSLGDLFSGYDQWPLDPKLRDMTAIMTAIGLVRFTCIPQGASNAVATFQRGMCRILADLIPENVRVFIDDIGIKGPMTTYNDEPMEGMLGVRRYVFEHAQVLRKVFEKIDDAELTFSGEKFWVGMPGIHVVGFVCDADGRHPDVAKTEKVRNWPVPQSLFDVRSFLGLALFYRILMPNVAIIAEPLYHLTKKNVAFVWTPECQEAFEAIKGLLTSEPVVKTLDSPGLTGPPILTFDACTTVGWGAVLGQDDENGVRHACRFESGLWSETEKKYDALKLETLGFVKSLKKFRIWLSGRFFHVEIDARTLIWMVNQIPRDMPNAMITRMLVFIRLFDFDIKHIPGKKNMVADALSRCKPASGEEPNTDTMAFHCRQISSSLARQFLDPRYYTDDYLLIGEYLTTLACPPNMSAKDFERFKTKALQFIVQDGHLYKKTKDGSPPTRVIALKEDQLDIIREMHDECGHRGRDGVFERVKSRYFWHGMYDMIKEYVRTCEACQLQSTKRYQEPLHPTWTKYLFSKFALDIVHMPAFNGFRYLLLARDDLSGWVEGRALRKANSQAVAKFVYEEIVCRYGCPRRLLTDGGPENRADLEELLLGLGIKHVHINAYHSQANGMIERGHQPIVRALAKFDDNNKWPLHLSRALWADRVTVRRPIGMSPFRLVFGQDAVLPVEFHHESWSSIDWSSVYTTEELLAARMKQMETKEALVALAAETSMLSREQAKEYYDARAKLRPNNGSVERGDLVLLHDSQFSNDMSTFNKLANRWLGPYIVIEVHDNGCYSLAELDGAPLNNTIAGDRVKRFYKRD